MPATSPMGCMAMALKFGTIRPKPKKDSANRGPNRIRGGRPTSDSAVKEGGHGNEADKRQMRKPAHPQSLHELSVGEGGERNTACHAGEGDGKEIAESEDVDEDLLRADDVADQSAEDETAGNAVPACGAGARYRGGGVDETLRPALRPRRRLGQAPAGPGDAEQTGSQENVERPAPGADVSQGLADTRRNDGDHDEDHHHHGHDARHPAAAVEVADDGHRDHARGGASHALQDARPNQHAEGGGQNAP